ncbi:MAG TPA: DJ-1/PfpI family protein [Stellaceae bacterium]|jgi:cyclohexyl-isocyanide hydratase|nr:DJ-1/PfpI family protein [Stellaceae bacterium]
MSDTFRSGMLIFPNLTQLDLTGPYEILARLPGSAVELIWKSFDPVRTEHGLTILPTATFETCGKLDLILVPGGGGMNPLLEDPETLAFLREKAAEARYVVGICTGSLVLGAAGLLRGKRAGTHWMSRDLLALFGATPVAERIVVDGNIFTGGGVTAGIDVALRVVAEIAGRDVAEAIQLGVEYDPQPPFTAGSPETTPPAILDGVLSRGAVRQRDRTARATRAAAAL